MKYHGQKDRTDGYQGRTAWCKQKDGFRRPPGHQRRLCPPLGHVDMELPPTARFEQDFYLTSRVPRKADHRARLCFRPVTTSDLAFPDMSSAPLDQVPQKTYLSPYK